MAPVIPVREDYLNDEQFQRDMGRYERTKANTEGIANFWNNNFAKAFDFSRQGKRTPMVQWNTDVSENRFRNHAEQVALKKEQKKPTVGGGNAGGALSNKGMEYVAGKPSGLEGHPIPITWNSDVTTPGNDDNPILVNRNSKRTSPTNVKQDGINFASNVSIPIGVPTAESANALLANVTDRGNPWDIHTAPVEFYSDHGIEGDFSSANLDINTKYLNQPTNFDIAADSDVYKDADWGKYGEMAGSLGKTGITVADTSKPEEMYDEKGKSWMTDERYKDMGVMEALRAREADKGLLYAGGKTYINEGKDDGTLTELGRSSDAPSSRQRQDIEGAKSSYMRGETTAQSFKDSFLAGMKKDLTEGNTSTAIERQDTNTEFTNTAPDVLDSKYTNTTMDTGEREENITAFKGSNAYPGRFDSPTGITDKSKEHFTKFKDRLTSQTHDGQF